MAQQQHAPALTADHFVREYIAILDEGFNPDLEEYLDRIPEEHRDATRDTVLDLLAARELAAAGEEPAAAEPEEVEDSGALADVEAFEESEASAEIELGVRDAAAELQSWIDDPSNSTLGMREEDPFAEIEWSEATYVRLHLAPPEGPEAEDAPPLHEAASRWVVESPDGEPAPAPEPDPEEAGVEVGEAEAAWPETDPTLPEVEPWPEAEPTEPELHDTAEFEPVEPTDDEVDLPGFAIERSLGAGTLGRSFVAFDEARQRRVVLKLPPAAWSDQARRRILADAAPLHEIDDPALVTFDSFEGDAAVVAEYVEGERIDDACASLDMAERTGLLCEVAAALRTAHAAGVAHFDLKPSNVIVTPAGDVRIVDFGIGIRALRTDEPDHLPFFAAPELVRRRRPSPASDVFSFGALMYAVLAGRPPFQADTRDKLADRIGKAEPIFPREIDGSVPEDLQHVCLACLARDPHQRPTMKDVARDLARVRAGRPARLRPHLYAELLQRYARKHVGRVFALASEADRDRLAEAYRRIVERETQWTFDGRRTPLATFGLVAAVVAATIALAPGWIHAAAVTGILFGLGIAARLQRDFARTVVLLAGALATSVPAALGGLEALNVVEPHAPFAAGVALLLSAGFLAVSRFALFAWTTAGLLVATYASAMRMLGFADPVWSLPLVAVASLGVLFESDGRSAWAAPFYLVGLATLLFAPAFLTWPWATPAFVAPAFLVLGLHGLALLGAQEVLRRSGSLDLRRASRILAPVAPVVLLGALLLNALALGGWAPLALLAAAALPLAFAILRYHAPHLWRTSSLRAPPRGSSCRRR